MAEILEAEEEYKNFRTQFEKLFASDTSALNRSSRRSAGRSATIFRSSFPTALKSSLWFKSQPSILLKNFRTEVDDGVSTAEEKGDGMQRALMLAIIKTYADQRRDEALGRSFIFFIDEGASPSPTAQRQLKQALLELADGHDQVFINTHSSVLLADNDGQQSLFRVAKEAQGETQIETIDSSPKKHEVIFELLGGSPADILLPANFLIVEGPSEVEFFKHLIDRHYSEQVEIHVLAANGDDERQRQQVTAVEDLLATIDRRPICREKLTILFDKPDTGKEQRFEDFKNSRRHANANDQLFVLPVHGLEDYYPAGLLATTQLANKVKLAKFIAHNITKEDFETQMPVMFQALEHCWANAYQD